MAYFFSFVNHLQNDNDCSIKRNSNKVLIVYMCACVVFKTKILKQSLLSNQFSYIYMKYNFAYWATYKKDKTYLSQYE